MARCIYNNSGIINQRLPQWAHVPRTRKPRPVSIPVNLEMHKERCKIKICPVSDNSDSGSSTSNDILSNNITLESQISMDSPAAQSDEQQSQQATLALQQEIADANLYSTNGDDKTNVQQQHATAGPSQMQNTSTPNIRTGQLKITYSKEQKERDLLLEYLRDLNLPLGEHTHNYITRNTRHEQEQKQAATEPSQVQHSGPSDQTQLQLTINYPLASRLRDQEIEKQREQERLAAALSQTQHTTRPRIRTGKLRLINSKASRRREQALARCRGQSSGVAKQPHRYNIRLQHKRSVMLAEAMTIARSMEDADVVAATARLGDVNQEENEPRDVQMGDA